MRLDRVGSTYVLTIDQPGDVAAVDAVGAPQVLAETRAIFADLQRRAQAMTDASRAERYRQASPEVQRQVDALLTAPAPADTPRRARS